MEHVSRFIHTIGPYVGDKELCLREFAKSLVDRAYTWYTTLRPGSIKTWDEIMERFCTNIIQVRTRSPSKAFRW